MILGQFGTSPVSDARLLVISLKNAVLFHTDLQLRIWRPKGGQWAWDCSIVLLGNAALRVLEKRPAQKWPERFAPRRQLRQEQSDLAAMARASAPPFCLNQGPSDPEREPQGAAWDEGCHRFMYPSLIEAKTTGPYPTFWITQSRVPGSDGATPRAPLRHVLVNSS